MLAIAACGGSDDRTFSDGNDAGGSGAGAGGATAGGGGSTADAGNGICTPGVARCEEGNVVECSNDGRSESVVEECSDTEYCDSDAASCSPQVCTADEPACDGDRATLCNEDGSGYIAGGTLCGAGQSCADGACADHICTPDEVICRDNAVVQCASDGLSEDVTACMDDQYCDEATPSCLAQICTPGTPVCDDNAATTCNDDGSGYTEARTDCDTLECMNGECRGCGDGVLDAGEEYDPPPGPFTTVSLDPTTCVFDFSGVQQLYCTGGCSWAGDSGCDQADADIYCKLTTGNPNSVATSYTAGTSRDAPGFSCPLASNPGVNRVNLGPMPTRGVDVDVWYQDGSFLDSGSTGTSIRSANCTQ